MAFPPTRDADIVQGLNIQNAGVSARTDRADLRAIIRTCLCADLEDLSELHPEAISVAPPPRHRAHYLARAIQFRPFAFQIAALLKTMTVR
jgi:hypothetical protein